MALTASQALDQTKLMRRMLLHERAERFDKVRRYYKGDTPYPWLPSGSPNEVRRMARMSRVNMIRYVVRAPVQALYVDGYRAGPGPIDPNAPAPGWAAWQANRLDRRQIGVHRAAVMYGLGYGLVLPGDTGPAIRYLSPRNMTTLYADDDDWPAFALERRQTARGELWRLFDDGLAHWVGTGASGRTGEDGLDYIGADEHGTGVAPVVRFAAGENLDDDLEGVVEPLTDLQDQINLTTFALQVAQHYGAHRQRYVIGWLSPNEQASLATSAARLWSFEDDNVTVGEFEQTDLGGYIESREASIRHLATISQTPVHELLGTLANLSADALVAARDSHNRALQEWRTMLGESHEQVLELAGAQAGLSVDPEAHVRWRDMEARSLAQTADALGKLVTMLGVPAEALWERIPGVTQTDIEEWRRAAAGSQSELDALANMLDRQAAVLDPDELKRRADAMGVLIRSGVEQESAAREAGLGGVRFSGAMPASLRLPEEDAAGLEGSGG